MDWKRNKNGGRKNLVWSPRYKFGLVDLIWHIGIGKFCLVATGCPIIKFTFVIYPFLSPLILLRESSALEMYVLISPYVWMFYYIYFLKYEAFNLISSFLKLLRTKLWWFRIVEILDEASVYLAFLHFKIWVISLTFAFTNLIRISRKLSFFLQWFFSLQELGKLFYLSRKLIFILAKNFLIEIPILWV